MDTKKNNMLDWASSPGFFQIIQRTSTGRWKCKRCGCTDHKACSVLDPCGDRVGCFWITRGLCSNCATWSEVKEFILKGGAVGWSGDPVGRRSLVAEVVDLAVYLMRSEGGSRRGIRKNSKG